MDGKANLNDDPNYEVLANRIRDRVQFRAEDGYGDKAGRKIAWRSVMTPHSGWIGI